MGKEVLVRGDAVELDEYFPEMKEADGGYYHSAWSSPEAFARYIKTLDKGKAWEDAGWDEEQDWYGSKSMEEAASIAENGWTEGAEQAIRVRDRILAAYPPQKRPTRYGVAGILPNIPKAVSGDIMNMRLPDENKSRRKPVITLISNMAGSCMVDQEALSNRAAVVAALVDQIEAAGYSVEILSTAYGSSSYGRKDAFLKAVTVMAKASDQPVDMKRLTFALGHASMFRRFVFADLGTQDICRRNLGYGLGYTTEMSPKSLEDKGVYYLPSANKNVARFKTEEAALEDGRQFLIDCLKKQRCPAFFDRKKFTDEDERKEATLNDDFVYDEIDEAA